MASTTTTIALGARAYEFARASRGMSSFVCSSSHDASRVRAGGASHTNDADDVGDGERSRHSFIHSALVVREA